MRHSPYEYIQLILTDSYTPLEEKEQALENLFTRWGKDNLYNNVRHLDFGRDQVLIQKIIDKVSKKELDLINRMVFDESLVQYVKGLHTKTLLRKYNGSRHNPDEMFLCMRQELSQREHVAKHAELKALRQAKANRKVTKLEKQQKKLRENVINLRQKEYTISSIARKMKISNEEVMFFLNEAGFEDRFVTKEIELPKHNEEYIGEDSEGRQIWEVWESAETRFVSEKKLAERLKHSYSPKFGIKKSY